MKKRTDDRRMKDLTYIANPLSWVHLLCPIKRHTEKGLECAYLVGDGPNIYFGNIHNPKSDDRKETFPNYAAIVEAGWTVD